MIKEIFVILLVLIGAIVYTRYKASQTRRMPAQPPAQAGRPSRLPMLVAALLVVLTLGISAAIYYYHWQDARSLYTVQVINSHSGAVQTYHVYRDDIKGRSFRTTDGRLISLSDAERMEVREGVLDASGAGQ
ncbi:MAG: hypothetical protein K0A95_07210 [Chromatiales bacterium]|nr:hypothetical protein [Gammaproteobacteria bacterium]MBW6476845.1 hypothetical protein [Chromatiales bacterium]